MIGRIQPRSGALSGLTVPPHYVGGMGKRKREFNATELPEERNPCHCETGLHDGKRVEEAPTGQKSRSKRSGASLRFRGQVHSCFPRGKKSAPNQPKGWMFECSCGAKRFLTSRISGDVCRPFPRPPSPPD